MREKGLTDNELARNLKARGFPTRQSTISRIRKGTTRHPDPPTARALADYFDVTPEQISDLDALSAAPAKKIARGGRAAGLSDEAIELARMWMRLPPFKQAGYKQAITVDAAVLDIFPELIGAMQAAMVATNPSYHKATEGFIQSRAEIRRQGALFDAQEEAKA